MDNDEKEYRELDTADKSDADIVFNTENTADEADIRFDPVKDGEAKTEKEIKKAKRKKHFRPYIIISLVFLILLSVMFIGWHISQPRKLNVCLVDKTIFTLDENNGINKKSLYRKHQGFFWILNQQKYVYEDGSSYDYKTDYFGPMLDENGQINSLRSVSELDYIPDLMYIADLYGAVDDTYGYFNNEDAEYSGLTAEEMLAVNYSHGSGATVIIESETLNSGLSSGVVNQITSLCGISDTGWIGRYIVDLADMTDVPDWAPPMYEQQEGVEWQFTGPGILLVSRDGQIIILEQKTDFNSKNLLKIYINSEYEKEFGGCKNCNFYNWFTLIEVNSKTETLATFEFDVNATGMEKMKDVSKTPRFAAITRRAYEDKAPVYFFAGDFNDYVSRDNYYKFLFSDYIYKLISFDHQGDITNFYWNFYNPLIKKILKDVSAAAEEKEAEIQNNQNETHAEVAKLDGNSLLVAKNGEWNSLDLHAVSINATAPGENVYSREYEFYSELIEKSAEMNANCILAKDLLPGAFYQALYEHNNSFPDKPLYLLQTITPPDGVDVTEGLSDEALLLWKNKINDTVGALHGKASVSKTSKLEACRYYEDVSAYVIAFIADTGIDYDNVARINDSEYSYSGTYASGNNPVSSYAAYLYDAIQEEYVRLHCTKLPVGIKLDPAAAGGIIDSADSTHTVDLSALTVENSEIYYFMVADLNENSNIFRDHSDWFEGQESPYRQCLQKLSDRMSGRMLITDVSISVNSDGVSERAQGNLLVSMLDDINETGCIGGVIYDLNDDWSALSEEAKPFTVPLTSNSLWHNVTDKAQMTGVISVETDIPTKPEIILADDDRVQHMYIYSSPEYLYLTVELLEDIDYDKEKLFVGIDTYQRNDGEYYYAPGYMATALSGMEYVLRWSDKQSVELWVTESYDKSIGNFSSKESYSGEYRLVSKLTYGGFSESENQFYQTGTSVYIRIPWAWLNVTDPTQNMVLNNSGEINGTATVVATNGVLFSVMIADIESKDVLYSFPEQKNDPNYKLFKWNGWTNVTYRLRERNSYKIISNYFSK